MSGSVEPPFTEDELEHAAELRRRVSPDFNQPRRDQCPHPVKCATWEVCVEHIAWYFRHQKELES